MDTEEVSSDCEEVDDEFASDTITAPNFSHQQPKPGAPVGNYFLERAKYTPLRLTLSERKFLRLLDSALQVSEYTDKIDTIGHGFSKPKRIVCYLLSPASAALIMHCDTDSRYIKFENCVRYYLASLLLQTTSRYNFELFLLRVDFNV